MVVGSVVVTANFVFLAFSHSGIWQFIVWDAVWGFVFGFVYTAANAAFLHDATPAEAAMYSSANTVIASAVGGIGPAIFIAVLTSHFIPHTPIPDPVVFKYMWIYAAIGSAVMAAIALLVRRPRFVVSEPALGAAAASIEAEAHSHGSVAAGPEPA